MYEDFLPRALVAAIASTMSEVPGLDGLQVSSSLLAQFADVESIDALNVTLDVYSSIRADLKALIHMRSSDRAFVDRHLLSNPSGEVIGLSDTAGRIVIGPLRTTTQGLLVPPCPFMEGPQVTLFGPPDSAKMSINAMNALHRKLPGEDPLVAALVAASGHVPRWGADSEDSQTPIAADLKLATRNLAACFDRSLTYDDPKSGKAYRLAAKGLSLPVKRIAGLALPDGDHLFDGAPLPLHLVELVQHVWLNRANPEALVLYIPKLENEEEAAYFAKLLVATEDAVIRRDPTYKRGNLRVILVFENPRAIFRIQAMADALHPYFLGGSLGWHDFLASTARLFRHDPNYRIPVKADPDIVIRNIKESHDILVRELGAVGGLKIGGMYGILYESGDIESFTASMVGYIRDVVTQLKRGLDGFWVAHPDFVRIGIALVEAWRQQQAAPRSTVLHDLVRVLVPITSEHTPLLDFIDGPDVQKLDAADPGYLRAVIAADGAVSPLIANDDPEEVRYNVFQALQYLADWLCGNGCVALPAKMKLGGQDVFVRVMDDLATTERSRWEVWAEIAHGRVSLAVFEQILAEEVEFIRSGASTATKRTEVRWEGEAAAWYPVAVRLLRQLMTQEDPPEFVTELLMPFTFAPIRDADDPWTAACVLCPGKYIEGERLESP
jgi:malate synthase